MFIINIGYNYEVRIKIDDNPETTTICNSIEKANEYFNIAKECSKNEHINIKIYDYNKNAIIKEYDSIEDSC